MSFSHKRTFQVSDNLVSRIKCAFRLVIPPLRSPEADGSRSTPRSSWRTGRSSTPAIRRGTASSWTIDLRSPAVRRDLARVVASQSLSVSLAVPPPVFRAHACRLSPPLLPWESLCSMTVCALEGTCISSSPLFTLNNSAHFCSLLLVTME